MKTKEFIKRVEELGFEYEKAAEVYFIYDKEGIKYASVCHTTSNQMSNTERAWDWIDKDVQEKLFDLLIEYAATPVKDREEEKKFYLKHKYFKCINGDSRYFQIYEPNGNPWLNAMDSIMGYKKQFTLKEIEETKEKFDTDLADFELVEVEDE